MNNILEGLRYAALGAAGFAVAAIVNPGNVNAQQLTEERVLLNCEQGKVHARQYGLQIDLEVLRYS